MKVLLIGGEGTIGSSMAARLSEKHQLVIAGRNSGNVRVNIDDGASIKAMFDEVGQVDAVVCIAGQVGSLRLPERRRFLPGHPQQTHGSSQPCQVGKGASAPKEVRSP